MLKLKSLAQDCIIAIGIVLIALLLMLGLDPWLGMTQTPFLLFFGAVPIAALYLGHQGGLVATVLSALLANYFFIPPSNSFSVELMSSGRTLVFLVEGGLISLLIGSLRDAQRQTKASLQQLSSSEAKFRRLVNSNIIGVASCDIYGAITDANDILLKSLGYTREDLLAGRLRWDEMTPEDLKPFDLPAYDELITKGVNTPYEKAFIGKQGQRVPVVVGAALLEDDPEQLISFILDVSDRKRAEQRLAVQYAVVRTLAEATTLTEAIPQVLQSLCESLGWQAAFFWQLNSSTNTLGYLNSWYTPDLELTSVIRANQTISFPPGIGLPGRIWASGQPSWIADLAQEPNFPRKESTLAAGLHSVFGFPVSIDQEILGVIECFSTHHQEPDQDLLYLIKAIGSQIGQFMERKQTEEELQASQAMFQSFMNYSPANAFIKDESGYYLYVNSRVEHSFNRPLAEWLGKTDFDFFSQQVAQAVRDNDLNVLRTEQAIQIIETSPLEDGEHYYLAFKFPIKDAMGRLLLAGMAIDITDRKQAEQEREQLLLREKAAREQAETANRIKDEFLAVLSHELRSPLNPILGWSKLLQKGTLDHQTSLRALETIERNAKLQTQLIDDLLDVSRILRGKMGLNIGSVDLVAVIESALETVRLAAEAKAIEMQFTLPSPESRWENGRGEDHPSTYSMQLMGDSTRLQQIVWNLLSNAIKFTPEAGRVEVRLEQVDGRDRGDVSAFSPSSSPPPFPSSPSRYAQITVIDTGKGINPDFLPYVFDYFRQEDGKTTRKFGGLGLGLAIVRHLAELHGGTVDAASSGDGKGATFTVRLPLVPVTQELAIDPLPSQSIDFSQLHILIVDDEEDMRVLAATILAEQGARIMMAASANEALQIIDRQRPDILISDIGMPNLDGYGLMQQIRQRSSEQGGLIPAIALTAYAGEYDQQQALKVGFQRHLAKPVEPEILVNAIAEMMMIEQPTGHSKC